MTLRVIRRPAAQTAEKDGDQIAGQMSHGDPATRGEVHSLQCMKGSVPVDNLHGLQKATAPVKGVLLLWLTWGALVSVLFTAVYLVEGVTRPYYDGWRQSISALSLGPGGWVQQADFALLGLNLVLVAFAWGRALTDGVGATWYPLVRGLEGISLVAIGLFSTDPAYGYPPRTPTVPPFSTLHGVVHFACLFLIIFAMMAGLFIMAARFWRDPHWRGWPTFSIVCAVLINLFIVLFGVGNGHGFGYAGVLERVATNIETVWTVALVVRLWAGVPFIWDASQAIKAGIPD